LDICFLLGFVERYKHFVPVAQGHFVTDGVLDIVSYLVMSSDTLDGSVGVESSYNGFELVGLLGVQAKAEVSSVLLFSSGGIQNNVLVVQPLRTGHYGLS
jgi:hypothetical protein